jgi:hypothetical protein
MAPKMPIMLVASLDAGELSGHPHGARTSTTPTHGEQNVPYREAADDVVGQRDVRLGCAGRRRPRVLGIVGMPLAAKPYSAMGMLGEHLMESWCP